MVLRFLPLGGSMKSKGLLFLLSVIGLAIVGVSKVSAQGDEFIIEKIAPHAIKPIKLALEGSMTEGSFTSSDNITMGYWVYKPGEMGTEKLPLIIYLHGSSLRGTDLSLVLERGLPRYLPRRINLPAIVVCPQCPLEKFWWDATMPAIVDEFITEMLKIYPVDEHKVSLTGHSMGGDGTWVIGNKYPERFARLLPISGSYRDSVAERYGAIPIWTFVAESDNYLVERINGNIVTRLKALGGNVRMTVIRDTTHATVPNFVYMEPAVIEWLLCK